MNLARLSTPAPPRQQYNVRGDRLLIYISNMSSLCDAYGARRVQEAIDKALRERLNEYCLPGRNFYFVGDEIVVDFCGAKLSGWHADDLILERVKAALSGLPILCGANLILINVFMAFGVADKNSGNAIASRKNNLDAPHAAHASLESVSKKIAAYRADMALAVNFFEQNREGRIVLLFQPVVLAGCPQVNIYNEGLLRRITDEGVPESCLTEIQALERLGMIDRLDRSVLWSVIKTLEENPSVRLGCNLSALSLRHDCWWRLVYGYLRKNPSIAERLTLEITETSAISQCDEAVNLVLTLRRLGCRIAIDDMGAGYSTVDFLVKIRPDIVKIDRAFVSDSLHREPAPRLLCNLSRLCSDLSPCVVSEGIESEEDLNIAINAGAHGVQGYFIEPPDILPKWLRTPVRVRDSFSPDHPCISLKDMTSH